MSYLEFIALRSAAVIGLIHSTAGSIPERDGDKVYNTCTVFGPNGSMLGKYRKVGAPYIILTSKLIHAYPGLLPRLISRL